MISRFHKSSSRKCKLVFFGLFRQSSYRQTFDTLFRNKTYQVSKHCNPCPVAVRRSRNPELREPGVSDRRERSRQAFSVEKQCFNTNGNAMNWSVPQNSSDIRSFRAFRWILKLYLSIGNVPADVKPRVIESPGSVIPSHSNPVFVDF